VVVSHQELKKIVQQVPKGFGEEPAKYRYDVIFLKEPLTAEQAMKDVKVREAGDYSHLLQGLDELRSLR